MTLQSALRKAESFHHFWQASSWMSSTRTTITKLFLLYGLRITRLFSVNRRERLNKPMRQLKKFLRIISNLRYIPRRQELFISTKAFVFWALTSGRITWCFQRREFESLGIK